MFLYQMLALTQEIEPWDVYWTYKLSKDMVGRC